MGFFIANGSRTTAQTVTDSLFSRGNNWYHNKQYEKAVACYERVVALGYESADLYYNLGNAYYKQKQFALAILHYEKALLLKPGDQDIRLNLSLANAHIVDRIDNIPEFFLKRWIKGIQNTFSPNQWAPLCLVFLVLAALSFSAYFAARNLMVKKSGFISGVFLLFFALLSLYFMYSRIHDIRDHESAIILTPVINVRSSPDEQSTNVFVLHEGLKVVVTDSVQNWKEIRIANGNKGWVPGHVLGAI